MAGEDGCEAKRRVDKASDYEEIPHGQAYFRTKRFQPLTTFSRIIPTPLSTRFARRSCVGFKYLKLTQPELLQSCHPGLVGDAVESLLDDSDDVKMGAAQILVGVMMLEKNNSEIPNVAFKNAWDALIATDEMSSHAADLLKLLSLISKSSVGIKLLGEVDCTALFRFLDHSSSTVQIEGMKLFASILASVALPPSFIGSLMLKLFVSSRSNHQIEGQEGKRLNFARTEAFKVAVDKMKEVGQR